MFYRVQTLYFCVRIGQRTAHFSGAQMHPAQRNWERAARTVHLVLKAPPKAWTSDAASRKIDRPLTAIRANRMGSRVRCKRGWEMEFASVVAANRFLGRARFTQVIERPHFQTTPPSCSERSPPAVQSGKGKHGSAMSPRIQLRYMRATKKQAAEKRPPATDAFGLKAARHGARSLNVRAREVVH